MFISVTTARIFFYVIHIEEVHNIKVHITPKEWCFFHCSYWWFLFLIWMKSRKYINPSTRHTSKCYTLSVQLLTHTKSWEYCVTRCWLKTIVHFWFKLAIENLYSTNFVWYGILNMDATFFNKYTLQICIQHSKQIIRGFSPTKAHTCLC